MSSPSFERAEASRASPVGSVVRTELLGRIRDYDWDATPLGPIHRWPQSLQIALRIMLDSPLVMWLGWGTDLRVLYNDAFALMTLGPRHPWALGRPAREVWARHWGEVGPRAESVLRTGTATGDACLLLRVERNGSAEETPHTVSYSPLPDDAGGVGGVLCVITDNSAHTIGERRAHEQQLRLIMDSVSVMIAHCDVDARYKLVNRSYADRFGLTPEQMVGRRMSEVIGERAYEQSRDHIDRVLAGESVEFEIELPCTSGATQGLRCTYSPERAENRVVGFVAEIVHINERRGIEDEVRDARARIEATLDASEIGGWDLDIATETIRTNRNLAEMMGFAHGEAARGQPLAVYFERVHSDDVARVADTLRAAIASGERLSFECRVIRRDGQVRALVHRGRGERSAAGVVTRIHGTTLDITAQRDAEERERSVLAEVGEANAKFRAFFDQGVLFAAIMDLDGTIVESNRLSWEGYGYTREQVVGRSFWDGPWWNASRSLTERLRHASNGAVAGQSFRAELPFQVANHDERLVDVSIVPIRGSEGRVIFLAATAHDITDRRQAESALRQKVEEMSILLETLPIGVFIAHDAGGSAITGNAAAQALLQTTGPNLSVSAPSHDRPSNFRLVRDGVTLPPDQLPVQRAARGEHVQNMELEVRFDNGTVVDILMSAAPLFDDHGRPRGAISTALDVTDRKRAMEVLRESDRRKTEFIAILAHELRNPLSPLQNGVALMRLAADDPVMIERSRAMMERQLVQLVRLVDDLLDISRISQGKLHLRTEPVLLSEVLSSAVEGSRPLIDELHHDLVVDVPAEPIWINADLTRLTQVFMNLLNNAAKYSEPGATIRLRAECEGADAVVSVRDAGIGIAADQLAHIFDVFSQLDHSIERSRGGLGIGLSIVQRLIEMHGGSIQAFSSGPGMGSEFVVRISRLARGPVAAAPSAVGFTTDPIRRRVLVVDDNRDGAETLGMILGLAGHDVRKAHDGLSALDAVAMFRPNAILLDIGLPLLNGYDVCRTIREDPSNAGILIVAVTGWGQEDDRQRARAAGFDCHLVKPVDPTRVLQLLAEPDSL